MDYKKAYQGQKVILSKKATLKSFNDETRNVSKGIYYIRGFWADICGLSKERYGSNDICIKSTELINFNN